MKAFENGHCTNPRVTSNQIMITYSIFFLLLSDNHLIKLKSGCEIYYETLLLMCSTEFGIPLGILNMDQTPANYVQINNRFDKILFYHQLRMFRQNFAGSSSKIRIVVYGLHVRAFEFISFLVKHGVEGNCISLVMPHQVSSLQKGLMLNDASKDLRLETILRQMVEDLGVTIYEGMNLIEINCYEDMDTIRSATFQRYLVDQQVTLDCDFFVSYWETYIDDMVLES